MKCVILAGGLGTRISEETGQKPKPMVEIGDRPLIWHIMKLYSYYGINEFIICGGYKSYVIKEYFSNYFIHTCDLTFDIFKNEITIHNQKTEPWKVTIVDTGEATMTGGRLLQVKKYIQDEPAFCFTYGDGLSNINIKALLAFHASHQKLATLTATAPSARFGALDIQNKQVLHFQEKPKGDNNLINGGFFVLSPKVLDFIKDTDSIWEKEPLENLAHAGELMAFHHEGFWQPMDTLRDKLYLEGLWVGNKAPWKLWEA